MKSKKILVPILTTLLLISIPTKIFGWLQLSTYESCNMINSLISGLLKIIAFIFTIICITGSIQYIKHSKREKKEKIKDVLTASLIILTQVMFLFSASVWVTEMGMELYWSNGQRYQINAIDGYKSYGIRILALILIIVYIIVAINYIAKSKQENIRKTENVIRWQMITFAIVAGLLVLAMNW